MGNGFEYIRLISVFPPKVLLFVEVRPLGMVVANKRAMFQTRFQQPLPPGYDLKQIQTNMPERLKADLEAKRAKLEEMRRLREERRKADQRRQETRVS